MLQRTTESASPRSSSTTNHIACSLATSSCTVYEDDSPVWARDRIDAANLHVLCIHMSLSGEQIQQCLYLALSILVLSIALTAFIVNQPRRVDRPKS